MIDRLDLEGAQGLGPLYVRCGYCSNRKRRSLHNLRPTAETSIDRDLLLHAQLILVPLVLGAVLDPHSSGMNSPPALKNRANVGL
jgi:hypothetical protein